MIVQTVAVSSKDVLRIDCIGVAQRRECERLLYPMFCRLYGVNSECLTPAEERAWSEAQAFLEAVATDFMSAPAVFLLSNHNTGRAVCLLNGFMTS